MSTSAVWSWSGKNATDSECQSHVWKEYEVLLDWVDLFTRDTISVLGICGNIVLIIVRMQRHLRNTFSKLLVALGGNSVHL